MTTSPLDVVNELGSVRQALLRTPGLEDKQVSVKGSVLDSWSERERRGSQATVYSAGWFLQCAVPWICDCALLCKVLAFHPATTTPWRKRVAIMAFPLAMHIPRLPLLIAPTLLSFTNAEEYGITPLIGQRMLVAEGALQAAENCYCSGLLLYKVSLSSIDGARQQEPALILLFVSHLQAHKFAQSDYAVSNQQARRARLGLRYFTESILFTFLPASVLQTGWLLVALVALWTPDVTGRLTRAESYLRMFNTFFSVNCGLLAVWWATARIHAQEVGQADTQLKSNIAKELDAARDMSILDWALGPIEPEESKQETERSPLEDGALAEKLESPAAREETEAGEADVLHQRKQSSK